MYANSILKGPLDFVSAESVSLNYLYTDKWGEGEKSHHTQAPSDKAEDVVLQVVCAGLLTTWTDLLAFIALNQL